MPSSITHYLFAQRAFAVASKTLPFIHNNQTAINFGTQGPDPLFFYGTIPWRKRFNKTGVNALGSALHTSRVFEKYDAMIKYAKNQKVENKDLLFSYIFGHGLHYLLDRVAHAYVFYQTGFDKAGNLTGKYTTDHALFESMIDLLYPQSLGLKPYAIKPHQTIELKDEEAQAISKMYASQEAIDDMVFYNAWLDTKYLLKFFLDSKSFKLHLLAKLKLKNSIMYSMMHKFKVEDNDKIDYLNQSHQSWHNPNTNELHNSSFSDLFEEALTDLSGWIEILDIAYQNKEYLDKLIKFCNNRGYDGIEIGAKMLYHKSVYEKGE
jgi:hypothetical protein